MIPRHKGFVLTLLWSLALTLPAIAQTPAVSPSPGASLTPGSDPTPVPVVPGHKPVIILKLDDFNGNIYAWQPIFKFLQERKLKASFGVICNGLEMPQDVHHRYDVARDMQKSGQFEFWWHGYDHAEWVDADGFQHNEFEARSYEEDKQRLDRSEDLALHRFGFPLRAYGPPGGGFILPKGTKPGKSAPGRTFASPQFYQLMQDNEYLKIWLYPTALDNPGRDLAAKGKITILDRDMNIENPTFVPNYERFIHDYPTHAPKRDYLVLQGHPWSWVKENRFENFVKIIDYLQAQGCTFMTPSEYCKLPPLESHPVDDKWMPAPAPFATPSPTPPSTPTPKPSAPSPSATP